MPISKVSEAGLSSDAQFNGFKNRIINGGMNFWQRGTSFTGINNVPTYSADRWVGFVSAAVAGQQILQSASVPSGTGFLYSAAFGRTAGNTNTNSIWFNQLIESNNMRDLAGQAVTLSFWARTGANYSGGAATVRVASGTTADQSTATYSAGPATGFTGYAAVINTTQSLTTTWTQYSFTGTVGSTALELAVSFAFTPTGTAGADDNIYITGVQLEKGSTATSFDYRPYGTELALCQRYFEMSYDIGTAPSTATTTGMKFINWAINGANSGAGGVSFQVPKRATPTIATYDGAGTINNVSTVPNGSTTFTNGRAYSGAPYNISTNSFTHQGQVSAGNVYNFVHFTASSEL
jgi:hypothetical protein